MVVIVIVYVLPTFPSWKCNNILNCALIGVFGLFGYALSAFREFQTKIKKLLYYKEEYNKSVLFLTNSKDSCPQAESY